MTLQRLIPLSIAWLCLGILSACGENRQVQEENVYAIEGAIKVPYPVYPNGSRYRVGGENGLKIVAFETSDSFEKVDNFYASRQIGMPRLMAMADYVRYSSSADDKDPWATYRPGIVIHRFNDAGEREAVGARQASRTNIIMSY